MDLFGLYSGIVENVKDPDKMGRVKARVPSVHGLIGSKTGFVPTNEVHWALPAGMPAGFTATSGGFSHIPEPGDQVWIQFLDGEPEKPVWQWGCQSLKAAQNFKLHQYTETQGVVGAPLRAGWVRNNHTIELNSAQVIATSSQGYRLVLEDGETSGQGKVDVATPLGNLVELDDSSQQILVSAQEDLYLNITDQIIALARSVDLQTTENISVIAGSKIEVQALTSTAFEAGTDFSVNAEARLDLTGSASVNLSSSALITAKAPLIQLGDNPTEPFVRGTQLSLLLTSLLTWLATHTHTSSSPGSPTSPPVVPPIPTVQPLVGQIISETIIGQ